MRKYFILLLFLSSCAWKVNGQVETHYTQFMHNKLMINPAYAGSKEMLTFTALYRNQWTGIDGAPTTYNVNAHSSFFDDRAGAGLFITGDQHGFYKTINVGMNYAYRIPMRNGATFSLGISGQVEYGKVDFAQFDPIDINDDDIDMNNNIKVNPNFGGGLFYYHKNYYVGLSAPTLFKSVVYSSGDSNSPSANEIRSYYLMGGFMTRINHAVKFKPAVLLTLNQGAPFEMDMNASFLFMDRVWVGASYRLGDSFDAMFQYQFNPQLKAGVAVDITTSELSQYSPGSFEVMLEYSLNYEGKGYNHLRFF